MQHLTARPPCLPHTRRVCFGFLVLLFCASSSRHNGILYVASAVFLGFFFVCCSTEASVYLPSPNCHFQSSLVSVCSLGACLRLLCLFSCDEQRRNAKGRQIIHFMQWPCKILRGSLSCDAKNRDQHRAGKQLFLPVTHDGW